MIMTGNDYEGVFVMTKIQYSSNDSSRRGGRTIERGPYATRALVMYAAFRSKRGFLVHFESTISLTTRSSDTEAKSQRCPGLRQHWKQSSLKSLKRILVGKTP